MYITMIKRDVVFNIFDHLVQFQDLIIVAISSIMIVNHWIELINATVFSSILAEVFHWNNFAYNKLVRVELFKAYVDKFFWRTQRRVQVFCQILKTLCTVLQNYWMHFLFTVFIDNSNFFFCRWPAVRVNRNITRNRFYQFVVLLWYCFPKLNLYNCLEDRLNRALLPIQAQPVLFLLLLAMTLSPHWLHLITCYKPW